MCWISSQRQEDRFDPNLARRGSLPSPHPFSLSGAQQKDENSPPMPTNRAETRPAQAPTGGASPRRRVNRLTAQIRVPPRGSGEEASLYVPPLPTPPNISKVAGGRFVPVVFVRRSVHPCSPPHASSLEDPPHPLPPPPTPRTSTCCPPSSRVAGFVVCWIISGDQLRLAGG